MKLLFSSASMPEVGLLKSLLDEEGITSEVRNEGSYPNFPGAAFQPEIWVVNEEDFPKACEIRDASQFSPSAGISSLVDQSQKLKWTDSIATLLMGLLMLLFAVVCVAGYIGSQVRSHAVGAVVFTVLGAFMTLLALIGRPKRGGKP